MGLLRCPRDTEYHVTFYCLNFEPPRTLSPPPAEAETEEVAAPLRPVLHFFETRAAQFMHIFEGKFEQSSGLAEATGLALETGRQPQPVHRWGSPLAFGSAALPLLGLAALLAMARRMQRPIRQGREEEDDYQSVPARSASSEGLGDDAVVGLLA